MPTTYTSLIGLALPATGELSGTWGTTVNDFITQYVDAAVAGAQTISGSQTAVTLSVTNGTSLSQAGSGSTGSAQYHIINCTGNPAGALTVTVPSSSRAYLVLNNTSTNQTVTVKGAATTGVTVAAARAALIAWNGTDFELVATDDASKMNGVLAAANGGTGQSSYTTGDILFASGSTTLSKLADVATGNALISGGVGVAPSYGKIGLTTHVSGTLPIANGGTNGTATPTAGTIAYGTGTAYAFNTAGTSGQPLLSGGSGAPTFGTLSVAAGGTGQTSYTDGQLLIGNTTGNTLAKSTLTAGSGVTITNGAGTITIAATGSGGTVTSVSGTGTVNGITLTGTVTSSGSLTLGGTLSGVSLTSQVTGTLPIANGGTGTTSTQFVNLASNVTGTLPAGNGGTGNAFFSVSGPASSTKTYTFPNENMTVGYRNLPAVGTKTGSYTLAVGDVGKYVQLGSGGSITIPTSTFAEGDAITLYNNTTGNITITCSAPTAYIAGTNTVKTSMTLATRGVATILFISSTICVVSGNVT